MLQRHHITPPFEKACPQALFQVLVYLIIQLLLQVGQQESVVVLQAKQQLSVVVLQVEQ
jgi:hypothetical protein